MSILILRIFYLITTLACLWGLSGAAPIASGDTTRALSFSSSVDTSFGQAEVLRLVGNGGHRGARAELRYSVLKNFDGDDELQRRGWVDDGSEYEVIERRGIKEFFQNIGNKIRSGFQKVGEAFRHVGNKIKEGFQTAGRKIKEGFQTAGQKIKEGFQTAGRKIKEGFQTAGRKIKEGFQVAGAKMKEGFIKAGHWIKETGAKVAKFGLKVIATVSAVASHVARFIPIIGAPLSTALKVHSFAMNQASNAIHADLGEKLNKGMHVMDIIQDPLGHLAKTAVHQVQNHSHMFQRPGGQPHSGPNFDPRRGKAGSSAAHTLGRIARVASGLNPKHPNPRAVMSAFRTAGRLASGLNPKHPNPRAALSAFRTAGRVASHVASHAVSHGHAPPLPHQLAAAHLPHQQQHHSTSPPPARHAAAPHPPPAAHHAPPPAAHHAPPPPHRAPPPAHPPPPARRGKH